MKKLQSRHYTAKLLSSLAPAGHLVLITSERASFDCRGDTSQFGNAESLIHVAMLTSASAWKSRSVNMNNDCTAHLSL